MAQQITVGTVEETIEFDRTSRPLIQNLGPDALYLSTSPGVTTATGVQVADGQAYEWPTQVGRGGVVYLVSDGSSDVRYMVVV